MPQVISSRNIALSLALFAALALGSVPAKADTITFVTPPNSSVSDGTVSAQATFTTSLNTITITLQNTLTNAQVVSVGANVTDLAFNISTGQTTGTLLSSSGQLTTISGGTGTLGAVASPTRWILNSNVTGGNNGGLTTPGLELCVICGMNQPSGNPIQTLVGGTGTGSYANANGSIDNNPAHNPFLVGPVIFTLNVPGVTASSTITAANFSFGTQPGVNVPGVPGTAIPEAATMLLFGTGLMGIGWSLRRWLRTDK